MLLVPRLVGTLSLVSVLTVACGLGLSPGCGGGGEAGATNDGSTSNGTPPGSTPPGTGTCTETPLFAPLTLGTPYGDGGEDLIRNIQIDETTGEMFFSDYSELYRLAPGAATPTKLFDGTSGSGDFWLHASGIFFAGALSTVLYDAPRTGGELVPIVSAPPAPTDYWSILSQWITVSGKSVYWIDDRGDKLAPTSPTGLVIMSYTVYTRPWSQTGGAATPLYQGSRRLESLLVAGNDVYFKEETSDPTSSGATTYRQLRVSAAGGTATETKPILNGEVLAGNDDEVVVSRTDFQSGVVGVFLMRPDGTNAVKLLDTFTPNELVERQGTWGIVDFPSGSGENFTLFTYAAATGLRTIGCVVDDRNTTIHAAALTQDTMYVSIYRNEKATILRYPL